jgi:hypothetical protein
MSLWVFRAKPVHVALIVGALLTLVSGLSLYPSVKLLFWREALAKVNSLEVQNGPAYSLYSSNPGVGMNVVIEYTYSVGTEHYFGGGGYPEYPKITGKLSRDDMGYVTIRYNPAHPERSVVPTGPSTPGLIFLPVGIVCIVGAATYSRRKRD